MREATRMQATLTIMVGGVVVWLSVVLPMTLS
jgi:hypothetical protein